MTQPRETTPRQTNPRETYPPGVTCFIDTERADVDAAAAFYGGLFGWTFEDRLPPDAPARFVMAELDGLSVAGIASASSEGAPPAWNTYISVESADAIVPLVKAAGGSVLAEPFDVGPAGRTAVFADPEGAAFRVWQAGRTHGAQLVNAPGAWNWSDLETRNLEAAKAFYTAVFGWEYALVDLGQGPSAMIRVPGYGEHLEALSPGTLARHKELGAPEGFSDAIGWMQAPSHPDGPARWAVTFAVADADDTAGRTPDLGGTVLVEPFDVPYVRLAVLRDPDGVTFAIGKFQPPE
jgi:predicted enzyme related to lactoylglutathione lyase